MYAFIWGLTSEILDKSQRLLPQKAQVSKLSLSLYAYWQRWTTLKLSKKTAGLLCRLHKLHAYAG